MSDIGVYIGGIDVNVGVCGMADRPQVSAHEGVSFSFSGCRAATP